MEKTQTKTVSLTDYLLNTPKEYLHLDQEAEFIKSCTKGPVAALPQAQSLVNTYQEIRNKESILAEESQMTKNKLLEILNSFNEIHVDSDKLEELRQNLMNKIQLEYSLQVTLENKYKLIGDRLDSEGPADVLDWEQIYKVLDRKIENFKSISDEMMYYLKRIEEIENAPLKETFQEFVGKYLEYLDKIHISVNKVTSREEAVVLNKEICNIFGDCPIMIKKAKELKEIAKNKNSLLNIVQRIKNCYRVFDENKESLEKLKLEEEIDIQKIELYEEEFTNIYQKGVQMEQTEKQSSLSQMKKSIESYLVLRKKEKDFDPIRKLLKGEVESPSVNNEMIGKRLFPEERDSEQNLKKVKTENSQELLIPEDNQMESESEKSNQESLASLENSELSDADSDCSNEYILKQRQKIRKLKSLVIRKKEEQNDLVNQSDEKTSSFLHKKFSLMLLFYKLRVLGLDLDTCSKTDIYLNTVKETDEMMKKTSLGKVTVSELKRLVIKCEEMKYFSQGYQKFKRLQNMFQFFKESTESMRSQFRGGLKITQEIKNNFLKRANLSSYKTKLNESSNGQFSIILTRKKHSLFTKNPKKEWGNLNNKRKTKLRLGTDTYNPNPRNSKKKVKEKLINAIYNQYDNMYCLCREPYELTSMIQFDGCGEWFHKECIKIPKYQMKRIKIKNCPACFFLHQSKSAKFPHFQKRKIPLERFLSILKTAQVLSHFILDERVDEIFYIKDKLNRLNTNLSDIKQKMKKLLQQGKELSVMWNILHNVAALYIYLPVKIPSVETVLLQISQNLLGKLKIENSLNEEQELKSKKEKDQKGTNGTNGCGSNSNSNSNKIQIENVNSNIDNINQKELGGHDSVSKNQKIPNIDFIAKDNDNENMKIIIEKNNEFDFQTNKIEIETDKPQQEKEDELKVNGTNAIEIEINITKKNPLDIEIIEKNGEQKNCIDITENKITESPKQ